MARKTTGPVLSGVMGRWSIFRDKTHGKRVQGVLTKDGGHEFEMNRARLTLLYREILNRQPATVSDADVIEFLARGEDKTRRYLKDLRTQEAARVRGT
jgi:hypothetical protein